MNDPARSAPRRCDVLVVGGGPSGAACAYWLATAGHDVVLVERKHYPREKTCGDGLTPRSVRQLEDMGLADELAGAGHRFQGLRSHGFGRTLELTWPDHPDLPGYGYVITRRDLDALVAERAGKAGAAVWDGTEAIEPVVEAGLVRGARVKSKPGPGRAGHVTGAAPPAPSRCAPATRWSRTGPTPASAGPSAPAATGPTPSAWPSGATGPRPATTSRGSTAGWTSATKPGNVLPGYGWIFPVGDGRVNVGIGLLSTFNQWKAVNTTHLLQQFAEYAPPSWDIRPETACGPATGRAPADGPVGRPPRRPDLAGGRRCRGTINPFNGEGIAYAYESGRWAADAVHLALTSGDGLALQTYQERLDETYALYYKVARAFVRIIGRPELMKILVTTGMRSRSLMEWVLRIMANLLRPDELGPAEAAYRAVAAVASLVPEAA